MNCFGVNQQNVISVNNVSLRFIALDLRWNEYNCYHDSIANPSDAILIRNLALFRHFYQPLLLIG